MSNVVRLHHKQTPDTGDTDEALVAACAAGDMSAFGELFFRYQADVYGFISRLSGTDDAELDDLVQNTFLQLLKSANRFEGRASVKSWMFAIASNVVKHYVRSAVRRKAAVRSSLDVAPYPAEENTLHETVERRVMMAALMAAVDKLSYKLRVVFVMCDVEGIPGVEAARALGIKEGTLFRRLHDARKKLSAQMERRASR